MLASSFLNFDSTSAFLASTNWLQPSWDIFIVVFFIIISLIYGISLGRDRIIVMIVAIYMSLAVVKYIPYITEFNASLFLNDSFALKVSVFLGLFILLFFFLSHSALIKTIGSSAEQGKIWHVLLLSFLHAGLFVSVTLSFFPGDMSPWVSQPVQDLFVSDPAKAVWILVPIIAMAVVGSRGRD